MDFKDKYIKSDYNDSLAEEYPSEESIMLRQFVNILETISKLTGHGELTITDYLRDDPKSLHKYGRALDIRVKDKSTAFYFGMILLGKAFEALNPRFRIQPHLELFRKGRQHIHIEIRDNKKGV